MSNADRARLRRDAMQAHTNTTESTDDADGQIMLPMATRSSETDPAAGTRPLPAAYVPLQAQGSIRQPGLTDRLWRSFRGARTMGRNTGGATGAVGATGGIAPTAELSMLMQRAMELIDAGAATRAFDGTASATGALPPQTLPDAVPEDEELLSDDALLQRRMQTQNLKLANTYNMLNAAHTHELDEVLYTPPELPPSPPPEPPSGNLDDHGKAHSETQLLDRKRPGDRMSYSDFQDLRSIAPHSPLCPADLMTLAQYNSDKHREMPALSMRHVQYLPLFLYVVFILSALFYIYVRITSGMEGLTIGLKIYSAIVLFVEALGALNVVFYGVWLLAKPNNSDIYEMSKEGEPLPLKRNYIVRVMIPCYKESLAIIQRTVLAARRASRPKGTRVIVYLCDDAGDAAKEQWLASLGDPDVCYVTGRDKTKKQLNGKSENLNFALRLLYPDVEDPEEPSKNMKIPLNELMCLFDADQTCSQAFFQVMLRYIDSGDDVGVALSPQLMYNVVPDCDIFNHQNVHFWEMMQPGMDAMGFISLTGTNMVLRARALRDAGWFPTNSVTEDWALGMAYKKHSLRCRYVSEYLAIGEAPESVKQAFQQRSRWSKGHFQVFWSDDCPLLDRRLGWFYRIMYSVTCLSYLTTGLSIPVLNIIPVLTILFGWFPITLTFWTAMAITVYYLAMQALTFYCTTWTHFKAMWLSNVSSAILWWPYLKASILTPMKQLSGTTSAFKTTLKGRGGPDFDSFKLLAPSFFLVVLNVVFLIYGLVTFRVTVNAAQAISMCWMAFNIVPHLSLILYAIFGPGWLLLTWCQVGMWITGIAGILAIVLMWLLLPREINVTRSMPDALAYFSSVRSGQIGGLEFTPAWRGDSGQQYTQASLLQRNYTVEFVGSLFDLDKNASGVQVTDVDLSGGFYEDGWFGPVKITKSNAWATAFLAWAMLDAPEVFDSDPALKDEAMELLDAGRKYLENCLLKNDTALGRPDDMYVHTVGDLYYERMAWNRPEDNATNDVVQVNITAQFSHPTDLTGQMAAGLAASTLALYVHDFKDTASLEASALTAWRLFNSTFAVKGVAPHDRELWTSDSFYDDRMWAASWMYRLAANTSGDFLVEEDFFRVVREAHFLMMESYSNAIAEQNTWIVNLDNVLNAAIVHAAVLTNQEELHDAAQSFIWDWSCTQVVRPTTGGRSYAAEAPYLGDTAMVAALTAVYSFKAKPPSRGENLLTHTMYTGMQCYAQQQARYILGEGLFSYAMIVGEKGRRGHEYKHIYHRGASCPSYPEVCPQDTPELETEDINSLKGALLWAPMMEDRPLDARGGNATVVSLANNAAMPLLLASLHSDKLPWVQCLASTGIAFPHRICRHDRPIARAHDADLYEWSNRTIPWGYLYEKNTSNTLLVDWLRFSALNNTIHGYSPPPPTFPPPPPPPPPPPFPPPAANATAPAP